MHDVEQNSFLGLIANAEQVRPDVVALSIKPMACRAISAKDFASVVGTALESKRRPCLLVSLHAIPGFAGRKQFLRVFADRRVIVLAQRLALGAGEDVLPNLLRFDGLQQHMNVAWLSKNRGDNHASNVRGQSAPALGRE